MGNIRRLKKNLKQPMALANTKMTVNGCQLLVAHPNGEKATATAKHWAGFFNQMMGRASCVNMRDMYAAHFAVLSKIESGEAIYDDSQRG